MRLIHFIPVMVITSIVYSQAMYVSDYNDYVGILASYDSLDSYDAENSVVVHTTTSISVAGSYIFNGTLELGIEYGKSDFKIKNDIGFENYMDGSEYSFEGGYHIKELLPVNIALRGFYKSMSFNSELLDESDSKLSEIGNGFGVEFYKSVLKDDTMELIPFVGIRKMTINSKFDDSNGDSIEVEGNSDTFTFGLGVKFNNFVLEASVKQIDGESEFSSTVGFIIPQKNILFKSNS